MDSEGPDPHALPSPSGGSGPSHSARKHGVLILEEAAWLRRFAQGLAGSPEDAEDLTQDSMIAALGHGAPIRNPRGLLSGIARKLSAQERRRKRRVRERERLHLDRATKEGTEGAPVNGEAFEEAARVDTMRLVLEELRALPASQQRVITLVYLDNLPPAEIARRLGISPATVRAHLSRGLAALRERLDQRGGGRSQWLGALVPWLARSPEAAALSASAVPVGPTAIGGPFSPVALLGLGTMKYLLALGVSALLFGLWWMGEPGGASVPEAPGQGAEDVAMVATLPAARPVDPLPDDEPREAGAQGQPQSPIKETAGAAAFPASEERVRLIDRLTGEAVPHMKVSLLAASQLGSAGTELESGEDGTLRIPAGEPGEEWILSERDRAGSISLGLGTGGARHSALDTDASSDHEVEVGPTYFVHLDGSFAGRSEEFRPRLVTEATPEATSTSAFRTGERPWVRFPFTATEIVPGPYRLRLEHKDGLWLGECVVDANVGIHPGALLPIFEARGAIRFELDIAAAPVLSVALEPLGFSADPWSPLRCTIGRHGGGENVHGVSDLLVPGAYRWTLSEGGASGEVTVVAGEVSTVSLGEGQLGASFSSHVLIDMTAHPEERPGQWLILVTKKDDGTVGFMASAESTDVPHQYKVPLNALAAGTWILSTHSSGDVRLEPTSVEVNPGSPPPTIRAVPPIERAPVTLVLKDADTGLPIRMGEATFMVGFADGGEFERSPEGALVCDRVPTQETTEIAVRAPGYRMQSVLHRTDRDGDVRELLLQRGWRSRVLVLDASTMTAAAGVLLSAGDKDLGRTPEAGWLWIEGSGPPETIKIDDPDDRYQILNSPYDINEGEVAPVDPMPGWIFVIADKR